MTYVALKMNIVVSIEKDGVIDRSMEHDVVVDVPESSNPKMGWIYSKPPVIYDGVIWFYPTDTTYFDRTPKESGRVFVSS
jgi:hypothetical protein